MIKKMDAESVWFTRPRPKLPRYKILSYDSSPCKFTAHSSLITRIPRKLSSPKRTSTDLKKLKQPAAYHIPPIESSIYNHHKTMSGEITPSLFCYFPPRSRNNSCRYSRNLSSTQRSRICNSSGRTEIKQNFELFASGCLEEILNITSLR